MFDEKTRERVAVVVRVAVVACAWFGCTTKLPPSGDAGRERYIVACLNQSVDGESESKLWHDLATWAFAVPDKDMRETSEEKLLDRATGAVEGLTSESAWSSAGRYFQAENFHELERPACARAFKARK